MSSCQNFTLAEGSTYFFSMLHDLTQVIDAQNAENARNPRDAPVRWEKPYLFIYTDFVHFQDDVHDWKSEVRQVYISG